MTTQPIMRDERTVATENASYRWAYLVLSFGLLVSTAYRSFVRHESSWDLIALVILGGAVAIFYQGSRQARLRCSPWLSLSRSSLSAVKSRPLSKCTSRLALKSNVPTQLERRLKRTMGSSGLSLRTPHSDQWRQRETPLTDVSISGAIDSGLWAWVELNYRPHAYQATERE